MPGCKRLLIFDVQARRLIRVRIGVGRWNVDRWPGLIRTSANSQRAFSHRDLRVQKAIVIRAFDDLRW